MKRFFASLLTCVLLLGLLPTVAWAAEDVPYLDRHWDERTKQVITEEKYASNPTAVTASDTTWGTEGTTTWYVASGNVTIGQNDSRYLKRVTVTGDVRLILTDGCTLTVYGGIHVADDDNNIMNGSANGLTIYGQQNGTGALAAQVIQPRSHLQTNGEFAGIGGNKQEHGGAITINGGTVNAIGGMWAAGIGGGDAAEQGTNGSGGNITINGGVVTAACLEAPVLNYGAGAGIGGGSNGAGGNITINGGTVTATGQIKQYGGAGIGGCRSGDGGTITINGGTVIATGGRNGAGIGSGSAFDKKAGAGGIITITDGIVNATGVGNGAGIGGGGSAGSGAAGAGGIITITGGTVNATGGGTGANIGGGSAASGKAGAGGTITITGGTVNAVGGSGAGIGGGVDENGNAGDSGSFSTRTNGNAFIITSSISDNDNTTDWSGVIFEGNSGQVYGNSVTLTTDATIPENMTLNVEEGQTLIIGKDVTLTNYGTITGGGTIIGTVDDHGTIEGGITIQDHAHQWDTEWSSDATNHWHKCTVTDCDEQSDAAGHTPGDWIVDQAATSTEAGQRHKACTVCGYVTATETIPATGGGSGGGGEIYTPPTYKPEVSKPGEGGSAAAVSPSNPKQGDTVTVTPRPDSGYEVDKISVTDRNGKPVEVTVKPDGTYTFQQPSGKVTIKVTYQPIDLPWNNPFTDVSEGDWYYEAVRFVQERGLMNDIGSGDFAPNAQLSRAQLAQILFNKEGRPAVSGGSFNDVDRGAWYADAVTWAAENGIVGGYGNGRFGPNDPITREQLAVMLWRYSGSPAATNKELHFNDTDEISGFALEAMRWAVENGILNGYGDGRLGPQGRATRAQVAQMLKNFIENQEENT